VSICAKTIKWLHFCRDGTLFLISRNIGEIQKGIIMLSVIRKQLSFRSFVGLADKTE